MEKINIHESYKEFIAPYTVYETYNEAKKYVPSKGYEIHHIVPVATQEGYTRKTRKKPKDDRCIILTIFNHILAHYFYCRDYPEEKSQFIALNNMCIKQGKELLNDEQKFLEKLPFFAEMREKGVRRGENHPMYGRTGENNPLFGRHHTEEAKKKNADAHRGKHRSEESKKKQSESLKGKYVGEKSPMYGKTPWNKGMKYSEEMKNKIHNPTTFSKGHIPWIKGKHHTEEAKRKMSENHIGKNPYKGKRLPEETLRRSAEALSKKVFQYDLSGNLIQSFKSVKSTSEQLGLSLATIKRYLHGQTPKNLTYTLSYN